MQKAASSRFALLPSLIFITLDSRLSRLAVSLDQHQEEKGIAAQKGKNRNFNNGKKSTAYLIREDDRPTLIGGSFSLVFQITLNSDECLRGFDF
ncbi:hypothetical protein T07_13179 [Trichinella nelsoni]|uniref:Uncharacterized protein n=1 Tax=Trichinella nelsoni TaxID=6336 RepID=A0A0V0SE09_9BILA|nr:hypothetical protein T07_13179 [Trichinella nelsoni]